MTDQPKPLRRNKPSVNQSAQDRIRAKRKAAAHRLGFKRVACMINAINALSDAEADKVQKILKSE